MQAYRKYFMIIAAIGVAALIIHISGIMGGAPESAKKAESDAVAAGETAQTQRTTVDLSGQQLSAIKIEPVGTYRFHTQKEAMGSIAYHEKDIASEVATTPDNVIKYAIANVAESDSPLIHLGQSVEARFEAYPDRVWAGKVSALGVTVYDSGGGNPAVDPVTHRIAVRCEIPDPKNELYPGMIATIAIDVQDPVVSVAIPENGVVRKGDGTMTVWVTTDRRRFQERTVSVGLHQNGYDQILEGLKAGELAATDGAVFVSNLLYAPPSD